MNDIKYFNVPFSSLKNGSNHLSFKIDEKFFEAFNYSEVNNSLIAVNVDFRKETHLFDIRVNWSGKYETICDRCLDLLTLQSNENFKRIIKFSHENVQDSNENRNSEVTLISYDDFSFDLSLLLFEHFVLSAPLRNIHSNDSCNNQQLIEMDEYLLKTHDELEKHNDDSLTDPRWDALKALNKKEN